jgi:hypothetical protein
MTVLLDTLVTRLALAVKLRDDLTGGPARGLLAVTAAGRPGLRNRSGHFVFLRAPTGTVTIAVSGERYLPETFPIALPRPDPRDPAIERALLPAWFYPFPAGSTLVTGRVTDTAGVAVPAAALTGVGRPTRTAENGRFAAYFRPLDEDDVVVVGTERRRLVKASDGTTTFQLAVSHSAFQPRTVTITDLEEGQRRQLAPIVLTPLP